MDRDELIEKFTKYEVELAEDLVHCLQGPPTAAMFRRMLLLFLRGHYSSSENYMGFDHLSCYTWATDKQTRKLEIEYTHNKDDRNPDAYPGIFVGFSAVDFSELGIGGNFAGNTQDLAGTHISKDSQANFSIFHVAKNPSDASDLAELTARALLAMGPVLAKNGGATGFEVMGMGVPREKKPSPKNHYTVATPIQINYTLAVTRSLESHRIRQIVQLLATES